LADDVSTVVQLALMAAGKSQDDGKCSRAKRDRLKDYRQALRTLEQAGEAVTSLRERVSGLEKRASELQLEAASLLDVDGAEEQESALVTTQRVVEAKLSRAREQLRQAEGGLNAHMEAVRGEFSRLHLIFRLHCIEVEKRKLLEQMVPGAPILSIEAVVINLRSIAELSRLEVNAQSVEGLVPQAERLLEAIQREPEFVVPVTRTASEGVAVAKAPEPRLYGPYLFRVMEEWEILTELARIRTENPGMDLAGATRHLAELHPELFVTEGEMRKMISEPLDGLSTGVYEHEQGGGYKLCAAPIGSTHEVG
jgi:hypothetical protein